MTTRATMMIPGLLLAVLLTLGFPAQGLQAAGWPGFDQFLLDRAMNCARELGAGDLGKALEARDQAAILKYTDEYDLSANHANTRFLKLAGYYFGRDFKKALAFSAKERAVKEKEFMLLSARVAARGDKIGYGRAITLYKEVQKMDPKNVHAIVGLGEMYLFKVLLIQAQKEFNRALQIEPNNIEALLGLVDFHSRSNKVEEAIQAAEHLAAQYPDDPRTHVKYADLLLHHRGQTPGSLQSVIETVLSSYRQAIALDKQEPEFLVRIILAMLRMNYDFTAAPYVQEALKLAPNHPRVRWMSGLFKEIRGDLVKAKEHYEAALQLNPNEPDFRYTYANMLASIPNKDFLPQTAGAKRLFYYLRVKNPDQALEEYQRLLKLDKGYRYGSKVIARIKKLEKQQSEREMRQRQTRQIEETDPDMLEYNQPWRMTR